MDYNKYFKELVFGICLILFMIAAIPSIVRSCKSNDHDTVIVMLQQPEFLISELSDTTLYRALVYYNVKNPEIVLAQAKLETGNYRSILCKQDNNIFGLYNSKTKRYMKFDHWSDCILGYKEYIEYKYKDGEDYYEFLKRINYAEDEQYIKKLKNLAYNPLKENDTIKTTLVKVKIPKNK